MRVIFTDTLFWVALVNPRDQWREQALAASQSLAGVRMVTTQEVLTEFLNALSSAGAHVRDAARRVASRAGEETRRDARHHLGQRHAAPSRLIASVSHLERRTILR